jgi:hypothetical protein
MNAGIKQRIIYLFQIAVGIALVIWIMLQVDQKQFVDYFLNLSLTDLIYIMILSVVGLWFQFQRWKYLVERYSTHYDIQDLIPSFFAGYAFRLIIPGGHAEFSKIFLLPGQKRGKALAFGMEKFFQTLIKIAALLIVLPITFAEYSIYYILIFIVFVLIYLFFPRLPLLKDIKEKDVNYHQVFLMSVLFALGIFIIMGLQYYILLTPAGKITLLQTYHTVVYLWGAGMVPVSISGLGIREGLAVYFFKLYGISGAHAVATSLFLFTINNVLPAFIGAHFIYRKRAHFKEVKSSVRSIREIVASMRSNGRSE